MLTLISLTDSDLASTPLPIGSIGKIHLHGDDTITIWWDGKDQEPYTTFDGAAAREIGAAFRDSLFVDWLSPAELGE